MKTFEEHKKNGIKTFKEVINESSVEDLKRDLEGLGVEEQTYSINDISDVFFDIVTESTFADENYIEVEITEEYETEIKEFGSSCDVSVKYIGDISFQVYSTDIIADIIKDLKPTDKDYEQERWNQTEIEDALSYLDWDTHVTLDASDAEALISRVSYDAGEATIAYELAENSYFVTADVNEMWEEFVLYLKEQKD